MSQNKYKPALECSQTLKKETAPNITLKEIVVMLIHCFDIYFNISITTKFK